MMSKRYFAAVLVLFCLALPMALAQTGPVTPGQPGSPAVTPAPSPGTGPVTPQSPAPGAPGAPAAPAAPAAGPSFDDQSFTNFLRQQGYKFEEKRNANGQPWYLTTVEKNGWRFVVELSLTTNHSSVNIFCHIGNPLSPGKATADQLLHLMELSRTSVGGAGFFTYRDSDHRLLLFDYCTANPAVFGPYFERVLQDARNNYAAWSWAN